MKKIWLLVIPILIIGIIQAQKIDEQNDTRTTPRTIVNEADTPVRLHTDRKSIMTNDLEAGTQDIKVEQMTKVKMDQGGLRKKELVDEAHTVAPPILFEPLHPHRLTIIEPYPEAENIDVLPKPIGKTWHKPKENLYIKGEMLIQLKNEARGKVNIQVKDGTVTFGIPALDILNAQYSVNDISRVLDELPPKAEDFGLDLIFLMKVPVELNLESVSEAYRKLEDVKEVSPHYIPFKLDTDAPPRTIPDDPFYDWSDSIVKGPECWAIPQTGVSSIILSILDIERLYETHADLDGNYLGMKGGIAGTGDHGTMCASVACAELNNATGMSGLAGGWNTTQGVLWTGYVFTSAADNITAITWSVTTAGARVLSESIGYSGNPAGLESAFEWAWDAGAISFAATGNDAASTEPGWPAYYGIVMAVGGCDADGELWDWGTGTGSNIGEYVDILGPGDAQYCCNATGYTNGFGGTSFATPAAAAGAALILSANPSLTPAQVRDRLIRAADYNEHKSPEYTGLMGAGIVDLYESVESYNVNVSVNELLDVPASPPAYVSIIPRAVVQNRGTGLASFDVIVEARLFAPVYADTVHITDLAPNTEYQQNAVLCQFKKWIPSSGLHTFEVYTNMAGDLNTENDILTQTVDVQPPGAAITDTLIYDTNAPAWFWSDEDYYWAVRCSPAQPCSVMSIIFNSYGAAGNYSIYTWNDASGLPGAVSTGPQDYYHSSNGWKTVNVNGHPYFTGDFHIGYQCAGDPSGPYNISDDGPGTSRSEYSADGNSWNIYSARNWTIRAIVKYPPPPTHDVMTQSIIVPTEHEITAVPIIPQAAVKNIGSSAETGFDVIMKIDSLGNEIYSSSRTITSTMGKYDVETVTFAGWVPNYEGGTYNARCYHTLSTDGDRSNDTVYVDMLCTDTDTLIFDDGSAAFYSGDSIYAGVRFSLDSPANILGAEYLIWKSKTGAPAPDVVACTVFVWDDAGGNPGTQLGRDTIMPPNTTGSQTYWHNWTLGSPIAHSGDFWCGIWQPGMVGFGGASDSTFEYILFDAASESYRTKTSDDKSTWNTRTIDGMIRVIVQYSGTVNDHDVMTKEITEPGTIVSTLYDYPIKSDVKNIGANTETFNVVARITESGGPQVYQQTQNVSNLNPGEITSVTFPDWQPAKAYDYYDLEVYTILGSDVNRSNDTIIQDSIFSTPNEIIWYDNGVATWYWGDPDYRYTAQRFSPAAPGWCIGCWVAMQSDVTPWTDCSLFVWDDDDGWQGGGLPDPTALRLFGPVGFDPGGTGGYWFYISFSPIRVDTFSDFFIGVWNAEPPHILMDDTTSVWRAFCAEDRTSDDWQPISYDLLLEAVIRYDHGAPPKPAYVYAQKNAAKDSIILYWQSVTQDILDDPTAIEWYEIYSNADPSYIPVGGDWLDSPSDTFFREQIPAENRHYLNYPVSVYLQVADKSNMGYVLRKQVNENPSASDRNWVSLPWHSEYATVSDLTTDLSPSGDPLINITNLRDDQIYEDYTFTTIPFPHWTGSDFAIGPGRAYEMVTTNDTILIVVGSNNPNGLVNLNENPAATDKNWVSIPYNAVYSTVSDITNEYSPSGDPLINITNLRDDQIYEDYTFTTIPFPHWTGSDFAIEPGRGYEFVVGVDHDTVWNPTEYSNEAVKRMLALRKRRKSDIEVCCGRLTEPDRSPVWILKDGCYVPASLKNKKEFREAGISHIVRCHFKVKGFENLLFTAYRPDRPYDVLSENIVGCGVEKKDDFGAIWFNVGNFKKPWRNGEEVVLIIEASIQGQDYFAVVNFSLNNKIDIQELGEIALMPIPEAVSWKGGVSWNKIEDDNIVGYSVYKGDKRLNNEVVTDNQYPTGGDVSIRPVFKGGYETVHSSQGSATHQSLPLSYAFSIYPNPFARHTRIDYALPERTSVDVIIYDVCGKRVKSLISEKFEPGYYNLNWRGDDDLGRKVSAGVYFIQMNTREFKSQRKVIFVR